MLEDTEHELVEGANEHVGVLGMKGENWEKRVIGMAFLFFILLLNLSKEKW